MAEILAFIFIGLIINVVLLAFSSSPTHFFPHPNISDSNQYPFDIHVCLHYLERVIKLWKGKQSQLGLCYKHGHFLRPGPSWRRKRLSQVQLPYRLTGADGLERCSAGLRTLYMQLIGSVKAIYLSVFAVGVRFRQISISMYSGFYY